MLVTFIFITHLSSLCDKTFFKLPSSTSCICKVFNTQPERQGHLFANTKTSQWSQLRIHTCNRPKFSAKTVGHTHKPPPVHIHYYIAVKRTVYHISSLKYIPNI
jgi:hypothetical protein